MGKIVELQPPTTVSGTPASAPVTYYQETDGSIDTSRYNSGVLLIRVQDALNCTVYVEGSDDGGQNFTEIYGLSTRGDRTYYLNRLEPFGAANRLYKILRWRIVATTTDWTATFRVVIVLK